MIKVGIMHRYIA